MRKFDAHHHLIEERNYADHLLKAMDAHEIERSTLIGLGPLFKGLFVKGEHDGGCADNKAVAEQIKLHPDRFVGLGYVRLGKDKPEIVDALHEEGFKGLKFTIPMGRYSAAAYFPFYEKASRCRMPCLFHTGVVKLPHPAPGEHISSFNMECIHLEEIAQEFPDLKIIIAHLGVQSFMTALTLIRMFPNIHADLSGSIPGWRANLSNEEWKRYLWFPGAHRKILYGSDVHFAEFADNLGVHESILDACGWSKTEKARVYHGNASELFDHSMPPQRG